MAIQAVAFDIDGTLYPNWRMKRHSLLFFLRYCRLIYFFAKVRKKIRGKNPILNLRETQGAMLAPLIKMSPSDAELLVETVIYSKWEGIFRKVRPYGNVRETLVYLKARGIRLGVLSDFPVGNKLKYLGLDGLWDVAMSSEETNYLKPRPEPFGELAKRLGCKPHEMVYVGNSLEYDIEGARGVGMKTILVSWRKKAVPSGTVVISNYKNFLKVLESLLEDR